MASVRRAFTDEFKAEAVRLVTVEGHSARQVDRDLGIHESLLRRWQRKWLILGFGVLDLVSGDQCAD